VRTYPLVVVEVTSDSHPFWTGGRRIIDSAGQVEKFHRRYGSRQPPAIEQNAEAPRENGIDREAVPTPPPPRIYYVVEAH